MSRRGGASGSARLGAVFLLGSLVVSGCGPETASVSGKVRFRRQLLKSGTVIFLADNGEMSSSLLAPDGTYHVPRVAPGTVRVAVVSHPAVPPGLQRGQPFIPRSRSDRSTKIRDSRSPSILTICTPIPEKYSHPEESGLVFTVHSGNETLDFDLEP